MIETERMIGRPWSMDDVEEAFLMYGDPEVMRYITTPEPDLAAMRAKMEWIIKRNAGFPEGQGSFPMCSKETGDIIGTAMIKEPPNADNEPSGVVEVGWHLLRKNWKQGYATEFGKALVVHGFNVLKLDQLHAVVNPDNVASQCVARRLGMRHVGQSNEFYGGELVEHFVLEREAWLGST